jgi:hypothetical protein
MKRLPQPDDYPQDPFIRFEVSLRDVVCAALGIVIGIVCGVLVVLAFSLWLDR